MTKVELPLEKLNEILDGGVDDGSDVLVLADLVIDKAKFAASIANFRLEEGDNLVYLVNNRLPQYVKEYVDDESYADSVAFVDGFSATLDKESDEQYVIDADIKGDRGEYIEKAGDVAVTALEEMEGYGTTFIVDSLDSWVGHWDELTDFLESVGPVAEDTNSVSYYLLPNLGFEDEDEHFEKLHELFDYVIHLKGLERSGLVLKYIDVRKPEIETKVPFDITPEGLVMYVPKILVTGPFNAGKSTAVQNMSDEAVSVDRLGTTVALDHGKVEQRGLKADVFGTPGQERFDWALDFLGESMFGCFIILDARNPDYERAKEMRHRLKSKGIPTVVMANFQNKDGALPPEEVEEELDLPTVGVDALHGEGLDEALETLFDRILSEHSWYYPTQ